MKEYDYEKRVMGSEASLSIVARDRTVADTAADALFAIAEAEETRFSRFRDTSELSRLNRERSLEVSEDFMGALILGRDLYRRSAGIFNPLVDIARFGYDADITVVKGTDRTGKKEHIPYNINMETVRIDTEAMTVSLQEGQYLDFGGYMKGHIAEKMARAATGCPGVLVNLGGDIYTRGVDAEGKPFVFTIDQPIDSVAELSFFGTNTGIATSGSYNRHWKYHGMPFFHILDDTGAKNPATEILSATVIAQTGAESDAFATVALILGVEAGGKFLEEKGFEYCFIKDDGGVILSGAFPLIKRAESYLYAE
ncbi:MAG: FAD:protein FMN transferase [Minisyncoccia bacterium]